MCSRRAQRSARRAGSSGSRHQFGSRPVPHWALLATRDRALALSPRRRFGPSCRYDCAAPISLDLEEGQFVAIAPEVCGSSRSAYAVILRAQKTAEAESEDRKAAACFVKDSGYWNREPCPASG